MAAINAYLAAVVVNALWQVSLVAAAAWIGSLLLNRAPGAWLHRMWLMAAAAGAVLPWLASLWTAGPDAGPAASGPTLEAVSSWLVRGQWRVVMDGRAMAVLAGLALAAFALRLLRIGWAYGLAWKLRQAATRDLPEAVSVLARRCEARMGLMNLDVRISARVAGPVTIGIVRPAVLLPEGLLERQGEEVTEAALAHEMAHVRRRDGTRKLVEELMLALIAWHPLARWLSAQLDHTRELACDEDAARAIEGPRQYSRSLVAIAMEVAARPVTAPGLCSMGEGSLRQRVERLLAGARRPPGWRLAAGALALVAAMSAAAFAVVVPASREDVGPRDTGQQKVLEVEALGQEAVRLTTPPPPPPPPPPKPPAGTRSRP